MRQVGGVELQYIQDQFLGGWATNGRIITIVEGLPKEQQVWAPHWASQPWVLTRKIRLQNIWLWRPVQLTFGRARGLWKIEAPLLKVMHKISHTPRPRKETVIWKEPGSNQELICRSSQRGRRQLKVIMGTSSWQRPFLGAHPITGILVLVSAMLEPSL